jgi:hypothetical protein
MDQESRINNGKRFLQSLGFDDVNHSKRTLFDHLVSTGSLLQEWGCSEDICLAGLFHAVYGTESFRYRSDLIVHREDIQEVIGMSAERIAWLFGISTSKSMWVQFNCLVNSANEPSKFLLTHRITAEDLACERADLLALANITLANALDQAQHLPARYDEAKLATLRPLLPYVPLRGLEMFNTISNHKKDTLAATSA